MLRLRITLLPPLAPLRALFLVEPATQSIGDLKAQLGRDLQQLSGRIPNDFGLEVDGWELLDSSGVALVREDDVISYVAALRAWFLILRGKKADERVLWSNQGQAQGRRLSTYADSYRPSSSSLDFPRRSEAQTGAFFIRV